MGAKKVFQAMVERRDAVLKGLQQALDSIDLASSEATCTTVVLDLKAARRRVCEAITFLNAGETDTTPMRRDTDADRVDARGRFRRSGDFLKAAGHEIRGLGQFPRKKRAVSP